MSASHHVRQAGCHLDAAVQELTTAGELAPEHTLLPLQEVLGEIRRLRGSLRSQAAILQAQEAEDDRLDEEAA